MTSRMGSSQISVKAYNTEGTGYHKANAEVTIGMQRLEVRMQKLSGRSAGLSLLVHSEFLLLTSSDFLQSLHFVDAWNLSQADDDCFQMLQVRDIEYHFYAGLTVRRVRGDVADVALGVSDHACDALQHAKAIVTENGQLDRICCGRALVACPFHVDLSLRF